MGGLSGGGGEERDSRWAFCNKADLGSSDAPKREVDPAKLEASSRGGRA